MHTLNFKVSNQPSNGTFFRQSFGFAVLSSPFCTVLLLEVEQESHCCVAIEEGTSLIELPAPFTFSQFTFFHCLLSIRTYKCFDVQIKSVVRCASLDVL